MLIHRLPLYYLLLVDKILMVYEDCYMPIQNCWIFSRFLSVHKELNIIAFRTTIVSLARPSSGTAYTFKSFFQILQSFFHSFHVYFPALENDR